MVIKNWLNNLFHSDDVPEYLESLEKFYESRVDVEKHALDDHTTIQPVISKYSGKRFAYKEMILCPRCSELLDMPPHDKVAHGTRQGIVTTCLGCNLKFSLITSLTMSFLEVWEEDNGYLCTVPVQVEIKEKTQYSVPKDTIENIGEMRRILRAIGYPTREDDWYKSLDDFAREIQERFTLEGLEEKND